MSLDYWHLSIGTVQLALQNHGFEYGPCGTAEFQFRVGSDWYYIYCANLPRLFIERRVNIRSYLGEDFAPEVLFSAINAINDKYHLVKVSREDEYVLRFTHCLREERYLSFKANLPEYIRELDDAVDSFKMAVALILKEEKEELWTDYINHMVNAEDDIHNAKRIQS